MINKLFTVILMGCFPWICAVAATPEAQLRIIEVESWLEKWAKSNKEVFSAFSSFQSAVEEGVKEGKLSTVDVERIDRAIAYAAKKHAEQFRNNDRKTPYIVHPLGVAEYVMRIGHEYNADIIIGALLHDVMDGTKATYEEIGACFGVTVMQYVQEVTGDLSLPFKDRLKQQIVQAKKQSPGATVIRLADKLHNMRVLMKDPSKGWSRERLDLHFQWVQAVVYNLPKASEPLEKEVQKTIAQYWETQEG